MTAAPGILIAHGQRAEQAAHRLGALARPSKVVVETTLAEFASTARAMAEQVAGHAVVNVISFVDPDDTSVSDLGPAIETLRQAGLGLPAVQFRHWVVALVGDDWDDHELGLADVAGPGRPAAGLMVTGRSSEARGLIDDYDEIAMASDLGYAILTSDMRSDFQLHPQWIGGITTVAYRRRVIVAALAAFHGARWIEEPLLEPVPSQQPFGVQGRLWPAAHDLGTERHYELITRGAVGGSALMDLTVSEHVFEDARWELLSDYLRSYFEQLASGMLSRVNAQIDRNRDEHLACARAELDHAAAEVLRESQSLACTKDFLDNVDSGCQEVIQDLRLQIAESENTLPRDHEVILREFERTIRKLPFPAAIAARSAGFAAIGIIVAELLREPRGWPIWAVPGGMVLGAVLALVLYVWYRLGVGRAKTLRRKYLRAIELRLKAEAELHAQRRMMEEATALARFATDDEDGTGKRLERLTTQVVGLHERYLARVADRRYGELRSTPYSVFVPSVADSPTPSLAQLFPVANLVAVHEAILLAILPREQIDEIDVDAADETIIDAVSAQVDGQLWRTLDDLLQDAPATHERVAKVMGTLSAPVLRTADYITTEEEIRRFVIAAHDRQQSYLAAMGGGVDYDGARPGTDPDMIQLLALRRVQFRTDHGGAP